MKENDFFELKTYLEGNNILTTNFPNNSGEFPDDKLKEPVESHNCIRSESIRHFRKNSLRNLPSILKYFQLFDGEKSL